MIEELKAAAAFVMLLVRRNLISKGQLYQRGMSEYVLLDFRLALFKAMLLEFHSIWDVQNPVMYQQRRAIRLHGEMNDSQHLCIERALEKCGLNYHLLRLHDFELDLIINPGLVFIEGGEWTTVYYKTKAEVREDEQKKANQPNEEQLIVFATESKRHQLVYEDLPNFVRIEQ